MKASVIIPAYNAAERLYLNLVALNRQNISGDDVEVIVVDNGSHDNTQEMLKSFALKYPLITVRVEKNRGIAYGRNQGILKAQGDVLIFHDSDMIASSDFIEKHLNYHEAGYDVVCGLFWKRIYTFFYSGFSRQQLEDFKKYGLSYSPQINTKATGPIQLLSEEQVKEDRLEEYSFDLDLAFIKDLKMTLDRHGSTFSDYYLPWRFFITNNLSVKRQKVFNVGLFDEKIVRYGYEDYDLGIRLYKTGSKFVFAEDIVSLHQEHPANYNYKDVFENILYICDKYNNIYFLDVLLVCLNDVLKIDFGEMNLIMGDYYRLLAMKPYVFLAELVISLLQMAKTLHFKPGEALPVSRIKEITADIPRIIRKARTLLYDYHLSHFVRLLAHVLNITLHIDLLPSLGIS